MLNIQIQCCGMLLLWIITYFFCGLTRLKVRNQRFFLYMLVTMNVCVVADILSVFAIFYAGKIPSIVVAGVCKFYLLTLVAVCFCGLLYTYSDTYINNAKFQKITLPFRLALLIFAVLILALPIRYTLEGEGERVYSYGPSVYAAYIISALILLSMTIHLIRRYKRINPRRRIAIFFWLAIWILAALIQYFERELLIVSFAGIVAVIIIYVMIENPEANIDRGTGYFNLEAMAQYLIEGTENNRAFSILNISSDDRIASMNNVRKQLKDVLIFVGGGELFLLFDRGSENISRAFNILEELAGEDTIFYTPDSLITDTAEELLGLMRTAQKLPQKDQKRRIFRIDREFMELLADRKRIENMIQEAIEDDRIEVYYQPIYSSDEKQFRSAEALVRIKDVSGKMIPPNVFIPVAEDNGAIIEVGKIVMDKVCRFMAKHEDGKMGLRYVEVNLSVVQGEDENLAEDIIQIINRHGVSSRCFNLEITESASIRGKEQLLENMNELIREGIDFSLDDFGTGQSNLDYMADMPVKLVKFDRKMTRGYFESEKVKHIMNAAIQMIHGMGMEIVAEGIETEEQLQCMLGQGIEYIQGYYFSKPVPEGEFEAFLQKHNH